MDSHNLEISIQIHTGGFKDEIVTFEEIKKKLDYLYGHFSIENIIIGWTGSSILYSNVKEYIKSHKTKMLLWFPVFSELGYYKEFNPVIDFNGNEIKGYKLNDGESFEFYCPGNEKNLNNVTEIFEKHFSHYNFDGIFLDKIRYPSFANGFHSIFSCFCSDCTKAMSNSGIDTDYLVHYLKHDIEKNYQKSMLIEAEALPDFSYKFKDNVLEQFFRFKQENVYKSVYTLYRYFKNKGMTVGLDVFAHSLGYFVGQDTKLLASCCDFIKHMYYRKTLAPAGMPFEFNLLSGIFKINGENLCQSYETNSPTCFETSKRELKTASALCSKTLMYPGFEVNRIDKIAPVYPDYINESMKLISDSGAGGVVLSWDVINAPYENLKAVADFMTTWR